MLKVQEYLQTHSFDDLHDELGIRLAYHPTLPLVILNYDQIESPKTNLVVRECRALVLHTQTCEVVARSFGRFFNWGEVCEEMDDFDFSDFAVQSKEDGSLVLLYHFDGHWRINTRGSFAQDLMEFQTFTWEQAICGALGISQPDDLDRWGLSKDYTYVCEFCSPWNKVVRRYEPCVYLLTIFEPKTHRELTIPECDHIAQSGRILRPIVYQFRSIKEIQKFIEEQMANDPTFEGVVMRDHLGHRWKVKSPTYLGLHRLRGEGGNLFNPKHLLPFVLAGDGDELLTYFPEAGEAFFRTKAKVMEAYAQLVELWGDHWRIQDQKEFALTIGKTPFAWLLFCVRKEHGQEQKAQHLRELWNRSGEYIIKVLFR